MMLGSCIKNGVLRESGAYQTARGWAQSVKNFYFRLLIKTLCSMRRALCKIAF